MSVSKEGAMMRVLECPDYFLQLQNKMVDMSSSGKCKAWEPQEPTNK